MIVLVDVLIATWKRPDDEEVPLMGFQTLPDNWMSNGNTYINIIILLASCI
jgi:hypothetical protein